MNRICSAGIFLGSSPSRRNRAFPATNLSQNCRSDRPSGPRAASPRGSPDRDQRAAFAQADELVDHAPAVRAPVDVVAQEDERIVRRRAGWLDQASRAIEQPWMSPIAIIRAMLLCLSGWMRLIRPLEPLTLAVHPINLVAPVAPLRNPPWLDRRASFYVWCIYLTDASSISEYCSSLTTVGQSTSVCNATPVDKLTIW